MLIPFILISIINTFIGIKLMGLLSPFKKLKKSFIKTALSHNSSRSKIENGHDIFDMSSRRRPSLESWSKSIESDTNSNYIPMLGISNITERKKKYSKTTKFLLSISTTYLFLHCPLAVCKIYYFLKNHHQFNSESETSNSAVSRLLNSSLLEPKLEFSKNITSNANSTFDVYRSSSEMEINLTEEIIERIGGYLYYLNFPLNFFLYTMNGSKFRKAFISIFKRKHVENRIVSRTRI